MDLYAGPAPADRSGVRSGSERLRPGGDVHRRLSGLCGDPLRPQLLEVVSLLQLRLQPMVQLGLWMLPNVISEDDG